MYFILQLNITLWNNYLLYITSYNQHNIIRMYQNKIFGELFFAIANNICAQKPWITLDNCKAKPIRASEIRSVMAEAKYMNKHAMCSGNFLLIAWVIRQVALWVLSCLVTEISCVVWTGRRVEVTRECVAGRTYALAGLVGICDSNNNLKRTVRRPIYRGTLEHMELSSL